MSFEYPTQPAQEEIPMNTEQERKENEKQQFSALAKELHEKGESLPFPGIDPISYETIRGEDDAYPGFTLPIDEIILKLQKQGMKIVLGKDSSNAFILPFDSDGSDNDELLPRHLTIADGMNEQLAELIRMSKNRVLTKG